MSVRHNCKIAIVLLILVVTVAGHASAQEEAPTATSEFPLTAVPEGTWLVGNEVSAGIYSAPGGAQCAWKRLSGFGGTNDEIIASGSGNVRLIVEISQTDMGFSTSGCGAWTLIRKLSTPTSTMTPTKEPTREPTPTPTKTPGSTATSTPTPIATPTSTPRSVRQVRLPWDHTPTPMATPTSTPTPATKRLTGTLGSRWNPVPFGQAVRVGSWEISVVQTVPDATKDVLQENPWNDPPKKDSQFYMVFVKAKYLGSSSVRFDGSYRLRALGARGVVYTTFENSCGVIPNELSDPELFRGGQIEGSECWEVASSDVDSLVMLLEPDFLSEGKRVWFSLKGTTSVGKEEQPTITTGPTPVVTIPRGWSTIVNKHLGYSLSVPSGWSVFDLRTGQLSQIMRFVDPAAAQEIDEILDSPEAEYAGHVAIELAIFSRPPISSIMYVGIAPLDDDIPTENVVKWLRDELESEELDPIEVHNLKAGTTNNLPSIRGVASADLSGQGLFDALVDITVLRANGKAYILVVVIQAKDAESKQQQIDQIVGSFRPE